MAEDHRNRHARTVYRKRKICPQTLYLPARHLSCRPEVDNCDLAGIRNVGEYPAGRGVELERFRVCCEFDVAYLRPFLGVDDRQPATAVADNDITGARVDADIVGVT